MGFNVYFIFVTNLLFLCSYYGIDHVKSAEVECNLKEYVKCSNIISEVVLANACPKINSALGCIEDVLRACADEKDKSSPVCSETGENPYCDVLDGTSLAPIASPTSNPDICHTYMAQKSCYTKNCGDDGDEFKTNSGDSDQKCSVLATKACVLPVVGVTEVNKDTCVDVSAAKNCYIDKLSRCGGSILQQHRTDVIIAGMVNHVAKCKEQGIGFTTDGDNCIADPMDSIIPSWLKDVNPNNLTKEECRKVDKVGNALEDFLSKCNDTSTSSSQDEVKQILMIMDGPRLKCSKAGYLDGAGVKSHPSQVLSAAASLLVLAFYAFQ